MVASALFPLAVASLFFALVRADAPWPTAPISGDVFKTGSQCNVTWKAATDNNWNPMSLELMSGPNLAMVPLVTLTLIADGSKDGIFTYPCPAVDINAPIFFIRFNSSKSGVLPSYATRFTIASAQGQTVPAPNPTQPDGSLPPWGTAHLVTGSSNSTATGTSSSNSTPTATGTATGSARSSSHALTPTGSPSNTAGSSSPSSTPSGSSSPKGSGSGSCPSPTSTVTVQVPTTTTVTSTATRFTTMYSFSTVTATPSVVTTTLTASASASASATATVTATTTKTVTASPSPSPSPSPNAKVATTPANSGALRRADLPVMHLLALAMGSAFITFLA